ncbi:class I SAM-dependent methyltransferase [Mycoplasmatota bacterium]|nr:class I SAM-dependent methyltransferase [Mycoplasmatota bacterium]
MKSNSMTSIAHLYLSHLIDKDDIVIDATMGNGYDTLFLAKHAKKVYAFDIQKQALESTSLRLSKHQIDNVDLILDSHENFSTYVDTFQGVIFNLGYLPHGDKSITTKAQSTIKTIAQMLLKLDQHGYMIIVIYPGHPEGASESNEINHFLETLDTKKYKIIKTDLSYQDNLPPYIIWISKT